MYFIKIPIKGMSGFINLVKKFLLSNYRKADICFKGYKGAIHSISHFSTISCAIPLVSILLHIDWLR